MIQGTEWESRVHFCNYKTIEFYYLHTNDKKPSFFNQEGLTFEDYIGEKELLGNELLYYPELTKQLRNQKDYPILRRTYPINNKLCGLKFIDHLHTCAHEGFRQFQEELITATKIVNHLIYLYGTERKTPIVTASDSNDTNVLYINGVKWCLSPWQRSQPLKKTEYLFLKTLFNLPANIQFIELEDTILGTPFIALRCRQTYKHRGQLNWYSLDTQQAVSRKEINPYKH